MTVNEAANMLPEGLRGNIWLDLGSGNGTFTQALSTKLSAESTIYAMDIDEKALKQIPDNYSGNQIKKHSGNFVSDAWPVAGTDGILMANSLHYVKDKLVFIDKLKTCLKQEGSLLLVEYDTDTPVPVWVPYPISFASAKRLFHQNGFATIQLIKKRPSSFGGNMYSALITR